MAQPRLIKKYANRRLYDTAASAHITLDGIRDLISNGEDVTIVDDTSGEDITRSVLLQIIAEQERDGRPMLDAELLVRIIRLYGNPMQEMMGEYLLKSLDAFMTQQRQFQKQIQAAMDATPMAAMKDLTSAYMQAWQTMQDAMLGKQQDEDDEPE